MQVQQVQQDKDFREAKDGVIALTGIQQVAAAEPVVLVVGGDKLVQVKLQQELGHR
jgi:hypothetical protein